MNKRELAKRRVWVIASALVLAAALFFAGLLSGLHVAKNVELRQQESLFFIEKRQQEDTAYFVGYIEQLDRDLQNYQLQERFINSLETNKSCAFADTYFNQTASSLSYYWKTLPARLEAYEREEEPSEEQTGRSSMAQ